MQTRLSTLVALISISFLMSACVSVQFGEEGEAISLGGDSHQSEKVASSSAAVNSSELQTESGTRIQTNIVFESSLDDANNKGEALIQQGNALKKKAEALNQEADEMIRKGQFMQSNSKK